MKKLYFIPVIICLCVIVQAGFKADFKAADKLRKQRKYTLARAAFERLYADTKERDGKFTARLYIAYCYRDAKKYDKAISELKKLQEKLQVTTPDKLSTIYLQRAILYRLKKDSPQSRKWAEKVLVLKDAPKPQLKIAYYNIGRSYFLENNYPQALESFNKANAVEADPAKCGRCTFKSISAYIKSTKKNLKQKK
jgi:tetratricopeptide (TPR) repeat protein